MRTVAARCRELGRDLFDWPEAKLRHMFILGYLHDIGYAFVEKQSDHEQVGGDILAECGLDGADIIAAHGDPGVGDMQDELLVLNLADMTTGPSGEPVTIPARLADIGERYGRDSSQYARAVELAGVIEGELARRGLNLGA